MKKLRESLERQGITRFNSVGDINLFLMSYDTEKRDIPSAEKSKLDSEIHTLQESIEVALPRMNENLFNRIYYGTKVKYYAYQKNKLETYYDKILSKRCDESIKKLEHIKETVDGLYPVISGAIGENAVVNELSLLPDTYYLINDFSVTFNPPIFNRKNNDRIVSIQVDHLLIGPAGVYIIETKNWGAQSVQNLDLRSPVDQIKRSSYALFVSLNSASDVGLAQHHWGRKRVPIRSIIAMTNSMPREEFQHVKVLSISKINAYITYFEPIFSNTEVEGLFNHLYRLSNNPKE
ncbi:MAG: NERD domain-containing protein [Bacteroidetes bacterium]|nr:NERD domain-containing protein [Bacteroidota bacterium]